MPVPPINMQIGTNQDGRNAAVLPDRKSIDRLF